MIAPRASPRSRITVTASARYSLGIACDRSIEADSHTPFATSKRAHVTSSSRASSGLVRNISTITSCSCVGTCRPTASCAPEPTPRHHATAHYRRPDAGRACPPIGRPSTAQAANADPRWRAQTEYTASSSSSLGSVLKREPVDFVGKCRHLVEQVCRPCR